jgi:hypothetical protein
MDGNVGPWTSALPRCGAQSKQLVARDHLYGNASDPRIPCRTGQAQPHWSRQQQCAAGAHCHRESRRAPLPKRYAVQSEQTLVHRADERGG